MTRKTKILLVEDDPNFGAVMRDYLAMNGYEVTLCPDGDKGWSRFINETFDLCILDVMMPGRDGFSLASGIRKVNSAIPLVFLTAKTLKEDIRQGYTTGADDYITKPFDPEILLLKLGALLKRSGSPVADSNQQVFDIGMYRFNHRLRELELDGTVRKLSPREADLLRLLCLHVNDILSREKALLHIWGEDNYFTGRSMDVFITRIRKYLKDEPAVEIVNVHGSGYRMMVHKP